MKRVDVLKYTTGSRMFGLNTSTSDFDYVTVYVNPAEAINPAAKTTTKFEFPEENYEVVEVELATFLRGLAGKDLKYIEAIFTEPDFQHPALGLGYMKAFVRNMDLTDMYVREITRRFNKTWYKELNPAGKNFNKEQGYDSKFAAHLFRVIMSAKTYATSRFVRTDFSDLAHEYLGIKNGHALKDDVFRYTTRLKDTALESLERWRTNTPEPEFPTEFYFHTVKEIYS